MYVFHSAQELQCYIHRRNETYLRNDRVWLGEQTKIQRVLLHSCRHVEWWVPWRVSILYLRKIGVLHLLVRSASVLEWPVSDRRTSTRVDVTSLNASCMYFTPPGYICLAKLTTCLLSRGSIKTIMYCAFILMVRLSLPFGNKCCTKPTTYVLQWWHFFVNRLVTLSSVSDIRSSITTKFLVLGSKDDRLGRPSTKFLFACVIDNVESWTYI